ncbi:unnamed protein product [Paramecium octaurelia]|uniref:Uncharacterized protein n=1 Tax=Paramecium octaurelia TaxID=43137 RepID=A0A8S1S619_PAROT|nr:unnamed protein product [Paramecium octaurelia]
MMIEQQSPQYWDDLILSSSKKESKFQSQTLEFTAQKLQQQLEKNKEFNHEYMMRIQRSQSDHREQYISEPHEEECEEVEQQKTYLNKLMEEFNSTYSPKIKRPCCQPKSYDMPRQQQKKPLQYSKEEVWQRLLEDKRNQVEQRENEKRKYIDELVEQHCTFKPVISDIASRRNTDQPVVERLYQDGIEQKKRKEQLKFDHINSEQFSFKPEISQIGAVLKGEKQFTKPLYERIDEVMKKKQEELLQKQQELQQQSDVTYQPKISQRSALIAEQKQTSKSVVERLMEDAAMKLQKKMNQKNEIQEKDECTFNPQINPTTKPVQQINQIYQTQYLMADFMREKKEKLIQEFIKNSDVTFKPQINKTSELMMESNEERLQENMSDKINRLGVRDYEKNQILKEQIQQAYYQQYTFKPQINHISSIIAQKRSLDDLAYNPERQEKLNRLKEEQESKQSFSYYPQTKKSQQYQHVKSKYDKKLIRQNMEIEKELKERKIQDLKRQMQYEELKECTFKPITKQFQKDEEPLSQKVKGVDGFFQNKENLKKKAYQQQEREKELFHYELKYDFKNHLEKTKPEPFKITQQNNANKRQLEEEAIQKEREQCTFHPKINQKYVFS